MFSCQWVKEEGQKTIKLCYKLQEDFLDSSMERKELMRLAKNVGCNAPVFSAAGFFEINKTTLFSLLSATTTYFIVVIQFSQSIQNSKSST